MGLSRAASALGVAVALGEIERASHCATSEIGARLGALVGPRELLGRRRTARPRDRGVRHVAGWCGPLAIDHAVMADAIDIEPVRARAWPARPCRRRGNCRRPSAQRLVAVLAKAEASHDGRLRGHRHTMLDDSDISSTRHARAFVCGALAGLVGHAEIYVSGGAEHQGPDGGGPVALIVERSAR